MPWRRIAAHGLFLVMCLSLCGAAPASAQEPQLELIPSPRQHPPTSPLNVQVEVHGTQGVNLCPYLRTMMVSVTKKLVSGLPESSRHGEEGTVVIQVRVRKDGSVPEDGLTVESTSGLRDMDVAARAALQSAAPFGPLPEAYGRSDLLLLFRISYVHVPNTTPRRT
jgi:TonB family protein